LPFTEDDLNSLFRAAIAIIFFGQILSAAPCLQWKNPERLGILDKRIMESSGIEISGQFQNRIYHINDSGSKGEFYITDFNGQFQELVSIKNFNPVDTEDMSLGPCGDETCLYIADTGDNQRTRKTSTIIAIKEKINFGGAAEIALKVNLKYPDGKAHDVESMAVHPNGNLYVITKDYQTKESQIEVAKVFWLPASELWENSSSLKTFRVLGQIDVGGILGDQGLESLVTSMAISSKGDRFALLTYSAILEFNFDISAGLRNELSPSDFSLVPLERLIQQEAIAYSASQDALIYTTEGTRAPIYQVQCQQR
jgi:hypothetical protein